MYIHQQIPKVHETKTERIDNSIMMVVITPHSIILHIPQQAKTDRRSKEIEDLNNYKPTIPNRHIKKTLPTNCTIHILKCTLRIFCETDPYFWQ